MSWRDNIVPGTLGGLRFWVRAKDTEVGRKTNHTEYPNSDEHTTSDSGKSARSWTFDAHLIGDDYLDLREAWIELLESAGPHVLVDPWGGQEYEVILKPPGKVRMRESVDKGGMITFSLSLIEYGDDRVLPSFTDPSAAVPSASDLVLSNLADDFADKFKGTGLLQQAANVAFAMSSQLRRIRGGISAKLNQVGNLTSAINEFENNIEALLLTPGAFAAEFAALISAVLGLFRGPPFAIAAEPPGTRVAAARGAVKDLFDAPDSLPPVPGDTPTRERQRANQNEISRIVRVACLTEAVAVFTTISYATGESADDVQQEVSEYFELVLDDPDIGDDLYSSMVELRALLQEHLQQLAVSLPALVEVPATTVQVALVLSYKLYGDVSHEQEIVDLNGLDNPAKLPAIPLKAVLDG